MEKRSAQLVLLIFAICLTSSVFAQELTKRGRYYVAEITKTFKVQEGGELIIDDVRGDVRVTTWDKK